MINFVNVMKLQTQGSVERAPRQEFWLLCSNPNPLMNGIGVSKQRFLRWVIGLAVTLPVGTPLSFIGVPVFEIASTLISS